jgi:hypothetical protein
LGVRVIVFAIAGALGSVAVAHADSSPPVAATTCHESPFEHSWSRDVYHSSEEAHSPYPTSAWVSKLSVKRDLDGDGEIDSLDGERVESYRWSERKVTLRLGTRSFTATAALDFHSMAAFTSVPAPLTHDARARAIVEDVLFPRVCSAPDPALARMLAPSAPLSWRRAPLAVPRSYAVYSTQPADRALVQPDEEEAGQGQAPEDTGGVWMFFDGDELGPKPHGFDLYSSAPRVVRKGTRRLKLLAHAVLVEEGERQAWLYVATEGSHRTPDGAGGQLPRTPTVEAARLDGGQVVVERCDDETLRIDLATGATTEGPTPNP